MPLRVPVLMLLGAVAAASTVVHAGAPRPPLVFGAGYEDFDCEQFLAGLACDGADSDFCFEGTTACIAGSPACGDTTTSTVEVCNGIDDDCDGATDEDFVANSNPLCLAGLEQLQDVSGDTSSAAVMTAGNNERFFRVRVQESDPSPGGEDLLVLVTLDSPVGADFDLYVYCTNCSSTPASSTVSGLVGHTETVSLRRLDAAGDSSFDIIIEVRFSNATQCATWSLTIAGDVGSGANGVCP